MKKAAFIKGGAVAAGLLVILGIVIQWIGILCFDKGFYAREYAKLGTAASIGMSQEDAKKEADSRGLKLEVTEAPSTEEKGIVTEQDPEPGKVVVSGSTVKLTVSNGEEPEGEVTYGLENLPVSEMSGMYTLSFTTDEDGVIASRQFVAESLTDASVSVKVKGKGSKTVKVSITSAQSGKTEVLGTYTFDFAGKKFTASSENISGAIEGVAVPTVPVTTTVPAETAAPNNAGEVE